MQLLNDANAAQIVGLYTHVDPHKIGEHTQVEPRMSGELTHVEPYTIGAAEHTVAQVNGVIMDVHRNHPPAHPM